MLCSCAAECLLVVAHSQCSEATTSSPSAPLPAGPPSRPAIIHRTPLHNISHSLVHHRQSILVHVGDKDTARAMPYLRAPNRTMHAQLHLHRCNLHTQMTGSVWLRAAPSKPQSRIQSTTRRVPSACAGAAGSLLDSNLAGFLMECLHNLGTGLLMGGASPAPIAGPLVGQCGFHVAAVVAMTCASLPLLAVDLASASFPARRRVSVPSFMLMGMLSLTSNPGFTQHTHSVGGFCAPWITAARGTCPAGVVPPPSHDCQQTTVAFVMARMLQIAAGNASHPPFGDADFPTMLSRIPPTAHMLSVAAEHEPMLVEPQSTSLVPVGSLVVVHPGSVVPLDGTVVWGSAVVEYAARFGRREVSCSKGSAVLAGSVARDTLVVQVSCAVHETRAARAAGYVVVDGPPIETLRGEVGGLMVAK